MSIKRYTALLSGLLLVSAAFAAPTETVLLTFSLTNGGVPLGGLISDGKGNLYGTTEIGGDDLSGTVFELSPSGGGWIQTVLYSFNASSGADGSEPYGGVIFDRAGNLYGTTYSGGTYYEGSVYELSPSNGGWTESVIYSFNSSAHDGVTPGGSLVFDEQGNLYGTTYSGGQYDGGTVFELSRSNGTWKEFVRHSFNPNTSDGFSPQAGLVLDKQGNVYGTTLYGGQGGDGTVFEFSRPNGDWTETIIHPFESTDGAYPASSLIFDAEGNLYGTTSEGGTEGSGTVFELVPSGGSWTESTLYNFCSVQYCTDGQNPYAGVIFDNAGSLYGTTFAGGDNEHGTVFQLKHSGSGWTERAYPFRGGAQGSGPYLAGIILGNGGIYGTTLEGGDTQACGPNGCGLVYEVTF
jgi:uncharacterized repeat protein (TIGR03803 family)